MIEATLTTMMQTGRPDDNLEGMLGSDKVNMAPPLTFASRECVGKCNW